MRSITVLLLALLCGCSTHFSTLRDEDTGALTIFVTDEATAFRLAYESLSETLPGREISEITGPVRGYSAVFRFVLDTYSQRVVVVPAVGHRQGGEEVRGFYYEVSGSGSSFLQGRSRNVSLFELLTEKARGAANPVIVVDHAPGSYADRDTKQPATDNDIAKKLAELKVMRDQGLITEQDYEAKKAELLKRM